MRNSFFARASNLVRLVPLAIALIAAVGPHASLAQGGIGEGDAGACMLKNHIYTCDGAAFQKALAAATTVSLETHNADGIARNALQNLVTSKLHKTIVPFGSPADLVFLLEPIDQSGRVEEISALRDLGTLRVYSTTPEGRPAHLLWAETYSSDPTAQDVPWPMVARNTVAKFEKRFQLK